MTRAIQHLVLPVPPSSNRFYRFDRGITHVSAEGRLYKRDVARACIRAGVELIGSRDVVLRLVWYRARKSGDLDNRLKQCLDACQGHLFTNDSQIAELRFRRVEDKANPRLEVLIALDGTPAAEQLLSARMAG